MWGISTCHELLLLRVPGEQRNRNGYIPAAFTVSNLNNQTQDIEASRSSIQDADFAAEAMELTKNQILTQSATAMLAQASVALHSFQQEPKLHNPSTPEVLIRLGLISGEWGQVLEIGLDPSAQDGLEWMDRALPPLYRTNGQLADAVIVVRTSTTDD